MHDFARTKNGQIFLANIGSISRSLETIAQKLESESKSEPSEVIKKARAAKLEMATAIEKDIDQYLSEYSEEEKSTDALCNILTDTLAVIQTLKEEL